MAAILTCSNRQHAAPTAAAGVSITPSGTAWSNSAWVEVVASAAADLVLTGAGIRNEVAATFEVDVGVGAAGAEVVIATFKEFCNQVTTGAGPIWWRLPIPIDAIPSGGRVAMRLRKTGTSTLAWTGGFITYLEKPLTGTLQTTTKPLKVVPAAAALTALASAPAVAWTNTAYTQMIASAAAGLVLCGVVATMPVGALELDIAVGGVGSETVVTTIRLHISNAAAPGPMAYFLPNPLDAIPAGGRVSARYRSASTVGSGALGLLYMEKPL